MGQVSFLVNYSHFENSSGKNNELVTIQAITVVSIVFLHLYETFRQTFKNHLFYT